MYWSGEAAEHMLTRHGITPQQADEVLEDDNAIWDDPDPSGKSGLTIRIVGWSYTRREVITVIYLPDVDGDLHGVNGWVTKSGRDRTRYREVTE